MSPFFYSYLITDPIEYGNNLELFSNNLTNSLKNNKVDIVCFRDKQSKDIELLAKECLEISKRFGIKKVLINNDIKLALKLGFDGVHLTSAQFDEIKGAKGKKLYTIISCHNEQEIIKAKEYKADAVTFSPIFYKEDKGHPKGCDILKKIVEKYQDDSFKIIALGGIIDDIHIKHIRNTDCSGFASIRYFVN